MENSRAKQSDNIFFCLSKTLFDNLRFVPSAATGEWSTENLENIIFIHRFFFVFDCAEAQWIRWKSLAAISICIQTSQIHPKYLQRWCLLSGFRFAIVLFSITKTLFQHFRFEIHVLKIKTDSGSEMMLWEYADDKITDVSFERMDSIAWCWLISFIHSCITLCNRIHRRRTFLWFLWWIE